MTVGANVDFCPLYQQSSTTKNIQWLTLPQYSAPKSMTNLGTVSLNAESFLKKTISSRPASKNQSR